MSPQSLLVDEGIQAHQDLEVLCGLEFSLALVSLSQPDHTLLGLTPESPHCPFSRHTLPQNWIHLISCPS